MDHRVRGKPLPELEPKREELRGLAIAGDSAVEVAISSLVLMNSPRKTREDPDHVRVLAAVEEQLPPIIVHRPTMRVIDGAHRVHASRLRDRDTIEVRFFDGSVDDAFLLAVKSNVAHGLPLSLADREAAAARIVVTHQAWSDRAIAAAVGLSPKTIAAIRRCSTEDSAQSNARIGRDGRMRPRDPAAGRVRANQVIAARPDASMREIAKEAGISVATVRDVRDRISKGLDPVPSKRCGKLDRPSPQRPPGGEDTRVQISDLVGRLRRDPSLKYTARGRVLLRWLDSRVINTGEVRNVIDDVPPHWIPVVAGLARSCAEEWQKLADELTRRGRR